MSETIDFETDFNSVKSAIINANSVRGALFALKTRLAAFGGCHLAYEYMIYPNAYVRGDLINMTTLPPSIPELYMRSGGTNADPIIENIAGIKTPMHIDIKKLTLTKNSRFYKNKFYLSLLKMGCTNVAAYPFLDGDEKGHGVFSIFADKKLAEQLASPEYYTNFGLRLHQSLKKHGQIARFFNINDNEVFVLGKMAAGKSAADIAQILGVTTRTIELRLQSVRKKLHARTTTEAVYKAVIYGAIN